MKRLLPFVLALVLTACAGAVPWNEQEYAGIMRLSVTICKDAAQVSYVCKLDVHDGKSRQSVYAKVKLPSGHELEYRSNGVSAAAEQAVRAQVETAVSADVRAAIPGVVDTLTNIILKGGVL